MLKNIDDLNKIKNKTILFGGSFNPPTIAHEKIIAYLSSLTNTNQVIILPNGDSYKFKNKNLNNFNHRFEMMKLITTHFSNVIVSDHENKNAFSGIVNTLEYFKHPFYVIGSDCLDFMNEWINADKLLNDNHFILFKRANDDVLNKFNNNEFLKKYSDHFYLLDFVIDDVSSSEYRNSKDNSLLNPEVINYIKVNRLYQ